MDGGVVGDRLRVLDQREQLVVAGDVQVALRLQHEEVLRHAGLVLLFFRLETALGEHARRARRVDALGVGLDVAGGVAHLRGHVELEARELALLLRLLKARAGQVRLAVRLADRIGMSSDSVQPGKSPANTVPSVSQ